VGNFALTFSLDSRTPGRPPEVGSAAFTTHLPDLPPQLLMVMDLAIIGVLVRLGRPRIWFLFVRSWLCYTFPSDPASRRRPCVSLTLLDHQVGQGTWNLHPKLLRMLGALKKDAGRTGRAALMHSAGFHRNNADQRPSDRLAKMRHSHAANLCKGRSVSTCDAIRPSASSCSNDT
jgi:hypothetical protein